MINDSVWSSLTSVVIAIITYVAGPLLVWYIANILQKRKHPNKDRIDTAFDQYEKLLKLKQDEIDRLNMELDKERSK